MINIVAGQMLQTVSFCYLRRCSAALGVSSRSRERSLKCGKRKESTPLEENVTFFEPQNDFCTFEYHIVRRNL